MATYKVIQDIEAEDKLLGPLSLRQFLYAVIVIACGAIAFKLVTVAWFLAIPFIFPMVLFGVLAAPFIGGQQPSEIWLLAKIRYYLLPRRKIWNQSGIKELVTITAPKVVDIQRTNGLNPTQVKSKLKALASTLDSRGWAIKNVEVNDVNPQASDWSDPSDRLFNPMGSAENEVMDIHESDDILDDTTSSQVAQTMQNLIISSTREQRERINQEMNAVKMSQISTQGATQTPTIDEKQALELGKIKEEKSKLAYANMKTVQPWKKVKQVYKNQADIKKAQAMTSSVTPDILKFANNDDLNVDTIARELNKSSDNEVVISLR